MSVCYSKVNDGLPYFNAHYPSLDIPNKRVAAVIEQLKLNKEKCEAAIAERRLPLPSAMEKAKKVEAKKYCVPHIPDIIYHLVFFKRGEDPIPFYVGICRKDRLGARESEHFDGVENVANLKQAYCFAREKIEEGYTIRFEVVCDAADATEFEMCKIYTDLGHPVQNESVCIDNKRQKKKIEDVAKAMTPVKKSTAFKDLMKSPLYFKSSKSH